MEVILIDSDAFDELLRRQLMFMKAAIKEMKEDIDPKKVEWLALAEAQKILPYKSKAKWQKLRDNREIEFSFSGRLILYNRNSLLDYIKRNKVQTY